jgi:hypothetical protein
MMPLTAAINISDIIQAAYAWLVSSLDPLVPLLALAYVMGWTARPHKLSADSGAWTRARLPLGRR